MKYLIGLDIGTSSVKGVLLSEKGAVCRTACEKFTYIKDGRGMVEIPAKSFLNACLSAIRHLAEGAEGEIAGLCASAATGNTLLLDGDGEPLTPIINWQDTRVTTEAEEVLGKMDKDAFYRQIGWPFGGTTFPLAHLSYWKVHLPKTYKKAKYALMSTEYLYHYLAGESGISTSAGTPFFLIDQKTGKYIPSLLKKLGLSEEMLPRVGKCGERCGYIRKEREKESGLCAGTPLILGSFDHPSAARGTGILKEGQLLLSCGTSWVTFSPIMDREKAAKKGFLIDPFLSEKGGAWGTMTSVPSVSARINEYVSRYIDNSDKAFKTLSSLAAEAEKGAGGLTLNITEAPSDEKVKGYEKKNIARAIMEGVVNLLKAKIELLRESGIAADEAVMVGGPSEDPMWRKLISEMCNMPVFAAHGQSAGAVGAAMMAGIGVGLYENEEDAIGKWGDEK